MSMSIAISSRKRFSVERPVLSCRAMLAAAALAFGISAAEPAQAITYEYVGNTLTRLGVQSLGPVTIYYTDDDLGEYWEIYGTVGKMYEGFSSSNVLGYETQKFELNKDLFGNITSWDINLSVISKSEYYAVFESSNTAGDYSGWAYLGGEPCEESGFADICEFFGERVSGYSPSPGSWTPTFAVPDPSNWKLTSDGVPLLADQGGYTLDLGNVAPDGFVTASFTLTNLNPFVEGQTLSGAFLPPGSVRNGGVFFSGFEEGFDLAGGESATFTVGFEPLNPEYFGPYFGNATVVTAQSVFGRTVSPEVFTPLFLRANVIETAAVPEPASWAMLIAGFGLTGAAMRRRRVAVVSA